jgi:hypothetical protein
METLMTKADAMKKMGEGRYLISSAEFSFAFGDITRDEFDAKIAAGNRLICDAMDALEGKDVA